MTGVPLLWSFRRCPYALRARMALAAAGMACELREIILGRKPDAFLATSPKGTVPVLVLPGGDIIEESLEVMQWALKQNDPEDWLGGDQETGRTLIAENDGPFKHHLDRYKYPTRYEGAVSDAHFAAAMDILHGWDERLDGHANLSGEAPRMVDIALFPFVRQFVAVERPRVEAAGLRFLLAWLDRHLASDRFHLVMKKYPVWAGGTGPLVFSSQPDHNPAFAGAASDVGV